MGYTIPGWLDEILDFIGVNFPNVDEDDYREMADAIREFANNFEGHGGDAHAAVSRILTASEGWAKDSLESHWGKVKSSYLDEIPSVAREFATALDALADIIFGLKTKAEVELGAMAASAGVAIGAAWVTGGLSALIGAAEIQAMRELVKRLIDEAVERVVGEVVAKLTEPVVGKFNKLVEDTLLDLADDALSLPPGAGAPGGGGGGGGHHEGPGGTQLDSVHGGGHAGGGGGRMKIDPDETDLGAGKLKHHGTDMDLDGLGTLSRARTAHSRTKGMGGPITQVVDEVAEGALDASEKVVKRIGKFVGQTAPNNLELMAKRHRENEQSIADALKGIGSRADAQGPGGGGPLSGGAKTWEKPGDKIKVPAEKLSEIGRNSSCKTFGFDPIDMATGQMFLSETDLALPGILPLIIERTHISSYRNGRFLGPSWASTFDERLERGAGGLWWHRTDGSSLMYPREPDLLGDQVWPMAGDRIPLTCVMEGGTYALAVADPITGLTRHFHEAPAGEPGVWWLAETEDRNGNGLSIEREEDGTPVAVRHDGGYHVEVTTEDGLVSGIALRTPEGPVQVMSYGYDGERNLVSVTNSSGIPFGFGYDAEHRVTSWTDRNGSTYAYVYDEAGRVMQTVGPEGYLSGRIEYDPLERTTRGTDSLGAATVYRTNERGQIIAETDPLGNTVLSEWDEHDNLLSRTDPLGNTTRFEWADNGIDLLAAYHPDGTTVTSSYNGLHLPTEVSLPGGTVWRSEYDGRGNRTVVAAPDGATTRFSHDPTGAVATVADALGQETRIGNDAAGLPLTVARASGAETTCVRDAFGRPVTVRDAMGSATAMEWTVEGKPARRIAGDAEESWTWDGEGNCLAHTDSGGGTTAFSYTHFDKLAARKTPDGARYEFAYDTELRLAQVRNPQGLTWDYSYDRAGQLVGESDFDDREIAYAYDAAGRLTGRTTPLGDEIRFALDAMGRTRTKWVGGAETHYAYNAQGALARAASPTCTLDLEYDAVGRLVAEAVDGRTTRYGYDAVGRRVSRTTPTGAVSTIGYDEDGNRASLATDGHTLAFAHDAAGREVERRFGDAVALSSAWDPLGRLTGQELKAGSRTARSRSYSYRADHHLASITESVTGQQAQFELDLIGRPLGVTAEGWSESYAYDQAGNQTHATWPGATAAGNRTYQGTRIQTAGGVRYEHDDAGRMVLRQKTRLSRKPDTWRYEWDPEDRLTACTTPDGVRWTYTYDPVGRRTAKYRLDADGQPVEATYFMWDGTRLAEQHHTASGITLTWEHDGHRPLAQYERKHLPQGEVDSRFFAIVTDLVGTPTELVDETGTITWHTRTTMWGTTAWNHDATAYTPLRHPGQYADPETGLHYNYFRHYDPDTARYVSPDPLGLEPSPNPVSYVTNPTVWLDPLGLKPGVCPRTGQQIDPKGYTSLFEMQLDAEDLGKSRDVHFGRANEALDKAIQADPELGTYLNHFSPGIADRVSSNGKRKNPLYHSWQHEPAANAGGRIGVLRLVPRYQHSAGSPWWDVLHPGYKGGYAEWAIPNGAPLNRRR